MKGLRKSVSENKGSLLDEGEAQCLSSKNLNQQVSKCRKQKDKQSSMQQQLTTSQDQQQKWSKEEDNIQEQPQAVLAENSLRITLLQCSSQPNVVNKKTSLLNKGTKKGESQKQIPVILKANSLNLSKIGQTAADSNCKSSHSRQSSLSNDERDNIEGSYSSSSNNQNQKRKLDNGNNTQARSQKANGDDDKKSSKTSGRWTKEEHDKFEEGLQLFGRNWKRVEEHIGTRTGAQIRSHAQKFYNRLEKEQQNQGTSEKFRELFGIMNSPAVHQIISQKQISSSSAGGSKKSSLPEKQVNEEQVLQNCQEEEEDINTFHHVSRNNQTSSHSNTLSFLNKNTQILTNLTSANLNGDQMNLPTNISIGGHTPLSEPTRKVSDDFDVAKLLMQSSSQLPHSSPQFFLQQQQQSSAAAWSKLCQQQFSLLEKDDSDDSGDCSHDIQLRQFYEQASKNPIYNQHKSPFLASGNLIQNYQQISTVPSVQIVNQQLYHPEEKDSEDIIDRYLKNAESLNHNNNNDNSFLIEHNHNLADIPDPKLYEMCTLGQLDQSSNSFNYKSEIYFPNHSSKKARSRFDSFKFHDEENESSNLKYQNLRKISIDDFEFKKKFKINDGSSIQNNYGTTKPVQDTFS